MHGASVLSLVILCLGADPAGNIPEQYTAFIRSEPGKWIRAIKAAGIQGE